MRYNRRQTSRIKVYRDQRFEAGGGATGSSLARQDEVNDAIEDFAACGGVGAALGAACFESEGRSFQQLARPTSSLLSQLAEVVCLRFLCCAVATVAAAALCLLRVRWLGQTKLCPATYLTVSPALKV